MFNNAEELLKYIRDEKVEQLDLKVVDLPGKWHHLTLRSEGLDLKTLTRGMGLSLSPYPGYRKIQEGDMMARPDAATAFLDPFFDRKTLSVICDIYYPDGETPYERNPRDIVRKAEKSIKKVIGVDAESRWLPEMEFYILDGAKFGNSVNRSYYELFSDYGSWNHDNPDVRNLGHRNGDTGLGQAESPRDRHANIRSEMVGLIQDAGYHVKYHHHELGGAGQCEIEPLFDNIIRAADSIMVMKYIIHNVALRAGKTVTFMPKPMVGAPGNGMHFHQYFMDKSGKSLFYGNKYASLSANAIHYIGGLLKHTAAMMAFCCPATNSYRRFGVGLAAPMNLFYAEANRSSAVRIPGYSKNPEEARVEYRLPDALCNPYIAIAVQLLAGLDGISKKTDPTKEGFGPFDVNNYELPPEERAKIKSAPTSLEAAVEALAKDSSFLTANKIFPKQIIDAWIELKLAEINEIKKRPHPYEFELYYDF